MFKLNLKFSLLVFLTFIGLTIVGTLSHEFGHIAFAEAFGYDTKLSHGSIDYKGEGYYTDPDIEEIFDIGETYLKEIYNNIAFEKEQRFNELKQITNAKYPNNKTHNLWIAIGGPLQTILMSLIGLGILYYRKAKGKTVFKFMDWIGVMLGLFILREVFNTVVALFSLVFFNRHNFGGDEFDISRLLELNQWVFPVITAIIGSIGVYYILFTVIPKAYRFSFVISGFIGGLLGYFIWFNVLGPIVLP